MAQKRKSWHIDYTDINEKGGKLLPSNHIEEAVPVPPPPAIYTHQDMEEKLIIIEKLRRELIAAKAHNILNLTSVNNILDLPHSLLHHILSFLTLENITRLDTSVLNKSRRGIFLSLLRWEMNPVCYSNEGIGTSADFYRWCYLRAIPYTHLVLDGQYREVGLHCIRYNVRNLQSLAVDVSDRYEKRDGFDEMFSFVMENAPLLKDLHYADLSGFSSLDDRSSPLFSVGNLLHLESLQLKGVDLNDEFLQTLQQRTLTRLSLVQMDMCDVSSDCLIDVYRRNAHSLTDVTLSESYRLDLNEFLPYLSAIKGLRKLDVSTKGFATSRRPSVSIIAAFMDQLIKNSGSSIRFMNVSGVTDFGKFDAHFEDAVTKLCRSPIRLNLDTLILDMCGELRIKGVADIIINCRNLCVLRLPDNLSRTEGEDEELAVVALGEGGPYNNLKCLSWNLSPGPLAVSLARKAMFSTVLGFIATWTSLECLDLNFWNLETVGPSGTQNFLAIAKLPCLQQLSIHRAKPIPRRDLDRFCSLHPECTVGID